jgi:Ser/Thr protein kinase RdoA (MazF antagonist)
MLVSHPEVQRLAGSISPESRVADLGGVMSLNVLLDAAGLVLRVHQPFVSRRRVLALRAVRSGLSHLGLLVPSPVRWQAADVFRCSGRWAEVETYVPHQRPPATLEGYAWLFGALGALHKALRRLSVRVPRPLVATYAPPSSLRRWMRVTEAAVRDSPEAASLAHQLGELLPPLRRRWVPQTELPAQLVHGDGSLSNICRISDGRTAYLDFGFLARRPRVHDLAYALAFMLLALGGPEAMDTFPWHWVPRLVGAYEATAGAHLLAAERVALVPYSASVLLHDAALDGFTEDPIGKLLSRRHFIQLAAWLLAHPSVPLGQVGDDPA